MTNPFKFGTIVEDEYFTNREKESKEVADVLCSSNHLILISPRRYGKTSLVSRVTGMMNRPVISLDLQLVTDVSDLASQLLKRILKINKWEKIKRFLVNFRIVPKVELNPVTNCMEVYFHPSVSDSFNALEDVMNLIEKTGEKGIRPIVVFDEFQEITEISKTLLKQLRSVIQYHKNVNYVFLGSLESMMKSIFETKKSPFYHFGYLMTLNKIPYDSFFYYLKTRLEKVTDHSETVAVKILQFTGRHPYYTQQLAYYCYQELEGEKYSQEMFNHLVYKVITLHNNDYERLWNTFSKTDKRILITLAIQEKVSAISQPTSTVYSGLKRLLTQGYIIRDEQYELDDPFFKMWIKEKRNN